MDITQIIGVLGAVIYLASYFLLQAGWIKGEGNVYAGMNMLAAACVLFSLSTKFNIGSFLIQISFILLSIFGIIRSFLARRPIVLSDREAQLANILVPDLPARRAQQLIRNGNWKTAAESKIATEGELLDKLIVLLDGAATVKKQGKKVADVTSGQVIGEFSCLDAGPATADVSLSGTAQLYYIQNKKLREVLDQNKDISDAFQMGLRNQLAVKLT
jgi:hypothetical protein